MSTEEEEVKFKYTVTEKPLRSAIKRRVEMRCEHCGCTDIELNATVYWNVTDQKWVVNEIDVHGDGCYCPDCGDGGMPWDEYNC